MPVICRIMFAFTTIILKSSHSVHSASCVLCYYNKPKSEKRISFLITSKIVSSSTHPSILMGVCLYPLAPPFSHYNTDSFITNCITRKESVAYQNFTKII